MKGSIILIVLTAAIMGFLVWGVLEYRTPQGSSSKYDKILDEAIAQDPNNEQIQNLVDSIRNLNPGKKD